MCELQYFYFGVCGEEINPAVQPVVGRFAVDFESYNKFNLFNIGLFNNGVFPA
jgi:hypothetical protein